jgi:hypothetical protein
VVFGAPWGRWGVGVAGSLPTGATGLSSEKWSFGPSVGFVNNSMKTTSMGVFVRTWVWVIAELPFQASSTNDSRTSAAQPLLQTVWNNLPLEKNEEFTARTPIDLNQLLPTDRRYYTYMGSLTTPPVIRPRGSEISISSLSSTGMSKAPNSATSNLCELVHAPSATVTSSPSST